MCLFHTIQRNLVAQSGDPDGTGKGGQSIFKLVKYMKKSLGLSTLYKVSAWRLSQNFYPLILKTQDHHFTILLIYQFGLDDNMILRD